MESWVGSRLWSNRNNFPVIQYTSLQKRCLRTKWVSHHWRHSSRDSIIIHRFWFRVAKPGGHHHHRYLASVPKNQIPAHELYLSRPVSNIVGRDCQWRPQVSAFKKQHRAAKLASYKNPPLSILTACSGTVLAPISDPANLMVPRSSSPIHNSLVSIPSCLI